MLRYALFFSFVTLAVFIVVDITYKCACESRKGQSCEKGFHCKDVNGTCIYQEPNPETCFWDYKTGNYCGEFQNCENSRFQSRSCPYTEQYCEWFEEEDNECQPHRSDLCQNSTTKEICENEQNLRNYQCYWNEKNICIPHRSLKACVDFNYFDMTSKCESYSSVCVLENGQCRNKKCSEQKDRGDCSYYGEVINRTHIKACYWNWEVKKCEEAPDLSVYKTLDECLDYLDITVFVNETCQFCNKLIQDSNLVQTHCYKDNYFKLPCQMDNIQSVTNASSTTTNSTSSNQTTTEGGQISTNSTTQQNSSATTNETTTSSKYSELMSILILATGLIV